MIIRGVGNKMNSEKNKKRDMMLICCIDKHIAPKFGIFVTFIT